MFVPPLESRRKGEYEAFHPSISHEFREAMGGVERLSGIAG